VEQKSPYLHDRLEAYRAAVEFYRVVKVIRGQLPRGMGTLADQLFRATQSICLNLAEGAAARSRDVKRRHWDIARGSQAESAAAVELIEIENAAPAELVARARYWLRITTLCTLGPLR
jgi:four helix bundle protein